MSAPFAAGNVPPLSGIKLEFTAPPKGLKAGDEVTTKLTFRVLEDLPRLTVNVAPFEGVEILSQPTEVAFDDLKQGDVRELEVKVRLTSSTLASLAVTYDATCGQEPCGGAMTIEYGSE